jgi:tetratricopeptide (TPR) repeat protein
MAELMLEYEQHILPVDLLFDDVQIGDYVKSIQIDSPYQQMLQNGVFTELVRNEKLNVSFTIEGYFHYVLGEVISQRTNGKGAEALKILVEENKLNGLKEGIEQCLIRDVNQDELARLIWLIDSGGNLVDLCAKPLAYSFLKIKGQNKSESELNKAYTFQIKKVTNELFADPSNNDIEVLTKGIEYLMETQKNNVVALLYRQINELIVPDNLRKSILYVKSIKHIAQADRNSKLQILEKYQINEESDLASLFYNSLGQQYSFVGNYDKAIEYYEKSLSIRLKVRGDQHPITGVSYNNLGSVWGKKSEYEKAIEYHEKSLSIRLKVLGEQHSSTGISYNNLGIMWSKKGNYDKAIEYHEKSLTIRLKIHGNQHPSTAISYNNLGLVWRNKANFKNALSYLEKSLAICLKVFGDQHSNTAIAYTHFGNVHNDKNEIHLAKEFYNKAYSIFIKTFGASHPHTKLLIQKLNDLK